MLDVADWKTEGADKRLGEADEDTIVGIAGQTWAIELLNWQLDVEGEHGVDVRVGAVGLRVSRAVGLGLGLLRRKQRLDSELDDWLLDWHQTERLELAQSQDVDLEIVLLGWNIVG